MAGYNHLTVKRLILKQGTEKSRTICLWYSSLTVTLGSSAVLKNTFDMLITGQENRKASLGFLELKIILIYDITLDMLYILMYE